MPGLLLLLLPTVFPICSLVMLTHPAASLSGTVTICFEDWVIRDCRKSGRRSCTLPLYAMEEQSADVLQHARFHIQSLE